MNRSGEEQVIMKKEIDCGELDEAIQDGHPVPTKLLEVPTALRLSLKDDDPVILSVVLQNMNASESHEKLRLSLGDSLKLRKYWRIIEEETVTEFAAIGVACVILGKLTQLRLIRLAKRGDRFDYFVVNETMSWEYPLEVAGRRGGDCKRLCKEKAKQLKQNPYGASGYVVVCVFEDGVKEARLSFEEVKKNAS